MIESNRLYTITIKYTLVFASLLLTSGLWLFILQGSFREDALTKSLEGVLEIAVPHLFAISVLAFVLSHFLLFIESIDKKKVLKFIVILYLAILLENVSHYFISLEFKIFAWIHLLALLVMVLGFAWLIYTIVKRG